MTRLKLTLKFPLIFPHRFKTKFPNVVVFQYFFKSLLLTQFDGKTNDFCLNEMYHSVKTV